VNKNSANDSYQKFFDNIHKLKTLTRRGWEIRGIEDPESVAEHSFGVAMLAMVLGMRTGRDVGRCVMMALVHDVGEAIIGDLTPSDGVPASQKEAREREAAREILETVDDDGRLLALWEEYATASSEDARFIKELDKLEMAFQAHRYERERREALGEFFSYVDERISSDAVRPVFKALLESRQMGTA